ncbi:hypothetical protein A1O3_05697 [Capronia epimyces CBS 606.96]|uniref:Methyltransferase n=1 Tax=Capronia epimyces CBS 606.96 TaxID=1182542 RepID=W9XWU2_9EURO|nr:uncharacterized protein A1O3_05697 [Capronia epimyces CBS 606.96]EXJ85022.1 hypothetical protein A1O3_05697 [Capronia epimyces CBS 606.96]
MTLAPARHEVADLTFLKWIPLYEKEKPFVYLSAVPKYSLDPRQSNFEFHSVPVPIRDVRGEEVNYTLDSHGFTFRTSPVQLQPDDFNDADVVEREYLPQVKELLRREVEGVDDIFIFDWRMRRADYVARELDMNDKTSFLPPSGNVHVDQSPYQATRTLQRARDALGHEKVDWYCNGGRMRIINVWRSIAGTVEDKPVTVCDGSTCRSCDLVTNDVIRSPGHGVREAWALLHEEKQKFYYLSHQTRDEVLMIKIFDSERDVPATCSPHTSFTHREIRHGMTPRRSIEVRAMIFTKPDVDA